jgi:hypothetical protein
MNAHREVVAEDERGTGFKLLAIDPLWSSDALYTSNLFSFSYFMTHSSLLHNI